MSDNIISWDEQKALNERNSVNPYKTSTVINFDGSTNTPLAAERVAWDSSVSLAVPTGEAKVKADAIDPRTLSGTNWDNIDIAAVINGRS